MFILKVSEIAGIFLIPFSLSLFLRQTQIKQKQQKSRESFKETETAEETFLSSY